MKGSPHGIVSNVLDCNIVVREFKVEMYKAFCQDVAASLKSRHAITDGFGLIHSRKI